jgi:putative transposase
MTTLDDVTKKRSAELSAEQQAAAELVRLAQEQGLALTKTVLETALNEEMTEHLGYEKHDPPPGGVGAGNIRNGTRTKTVLTDNTGPVELDVPRDRASTFEPQIIKKRQRRLSGVDESGESGGALNAGAVHQDVDGPPSSSTRWTRVAT